MYQRLLFSLSVLLISGAAISQNVMTPADAIYQYKPNDPQGLTNPAVGGPNQIQKWVYDSTQQPASRYNPAWPSKFHDGFKCYRFGTLSYRLRFPNNYNPANKYPLVIFLHGAGEAASVVKNPGGVNYENNDQLFWGAQVFEQRMNSNEWNGFLLFPQLFSGSSEWVGNSTIPPINNILDTLEKYNGLDPFRVTVMGLSAGGLGTLNYIKTFPQRIAGSITSCPESVSGINGDVPSFLQIPVWLGAGGLDGGGSNPTPANIFALRDIMVSAGGNMYLSYFSTLGHVMWNSQWAETDKNNKNMTSTFFNTAHKAQPLLYYSNDKFCAGQPISAKMGVTPGYYSYEWQYDNGTGFATIGGATANTYTATQAGRYQVRIKRFATDSILEWTPNPVVISTKACVIGDTAFVTHFDESPPTYFGVFNSGYGYQNVNCQNGLFVNGTESFSQDASGRQGGTYMLSTTSSNCTYQAGNQVWRTNNSYPVTANTNYTFSFYMGNHSLNPSYTPSTPVAALTPTINDVPLTPANVTATLTGNISWKKYSFSWNSGSNTSAQFAILNNTSSSSGNDFVIDEISLVKAKTPEMPAGVNATLWAKANTIAANDSGPVGLWTNSDVNGNPLQQNIFGAEPLFKKNAVDNINFNPVVSYNSFSNKSNYVPGGFSGTALHNSAHVYVVTKFGSAITTDQALVYEGQGAGSLSIAAAANGVMTWTVGAGNGSILSTPSNTNELNKPIVWTFSKDNINNTGNGNKQDIRKNGLLVKGSSDNSSFTGNNSNFNVGVTGGNSTLNASVAEIIYLLDTSLNAATENKIESYLAVKYGTTLGYKAQPVAYTASNGTVIWPTNWVNSLNYQSDVFGIGTDSTSGLVQSISNSVNSGTGNGTGITKKGNLVLSTNTTLLDKRFLMIGNDSASLSQVTVTGVSALVNGSTRIARTWKAYNTGAVGPVNISFDTTGLGNQAGGSTVTNYAIMVDTDGDGTFSGSTLAFYTAGSASGKIINFPGVVLNNGVNGGAVFTIITLKSNSLLPAIWLGFTAQAVDGNALLNWKTSDEMNVDYYTVEHSFNGVSFSAVGTVTANNFTSVNQYSLTDKNLAAGVHYYRIRRTDKDGKFEYTDIKTVKITVGGANVQVRPNPVVGSTLVLAITVQQSNKTLVQVMGVDGKIILQQNINLNAGNNLVNLNVANIPSGVYLVQVKMSDEVVTKKFIRQN